MERRKHSLVQYYVPRARRLLVNILQFLTVKQAKKRYEGQWQSYLFQVFVSYERYAAPNPMGCILDVLSIVLATLRIVTDVKLPFGILNNINCVK